MTSSSDPLPPDGLDEKQLAHMKRLRLILRFLAKDERLAHMQGRIKVFGSAAAGKPCPGDIDVYVDFSDCRESFQHPSVIPGTGLLLSVANQFYGCFDPFVRVGKVLYVRSERGNDWAYAKQVRAMRAAGEAGRPLRDVFEEIIGRPPELGGRPPPKEPEPDDAPPSPGR